MLGVNLVGGIFWELARVNTNVTSFRGALEYRSFLRFERRVLKNISCYRFDHD